MRTFAHSSSQAFGAEYKRSQNAENKKVSVVLISEQASLVLKAAHRFAFIDGWPIAKAHSALALVIELYDWDWQGAGKQYRKALELNAKLRHRPLLVWRIPPSNRAK